MANESSERCVIPQIQLCRGVWKTPWQKVTARCKTKFCWHGSDESIGVKPFMGYFGLVVKPLAFPTLLIASIKSMRVYMYWTGSYFTQRLISRQCTSGLPKPRCIGCGVNQSKCTNRQSPFLATLNSFKKRNPMWWCLVDEAYVFCAQSASTLDHQYPNLLVVQTLSKSRALRVFAWLQLGHPELIEGARALEELFHSYPWIV